MTAAPVSDHMRYSASFKSCSCMLCCDRVDVSSKLCSWSQEQCPIMSLNLYREFYRSGGICFQANYVHDVFVLFLYMVCI